MVTTNAWIVVFDISSAAFSSTHLVSGSDLYLLVQGMRRLILILVLVCTHTHHHCYRFTNTKARSAVLNEEKAWRRLNLMCVSLKCQIFFRWKSWHIVQFLSTFSFHCNDWRFPNIIQFLKAILSNNQNVQCILFIGLQQCKQLSQIHFKACLQQKCLLSVHVCLSVSILDSTSYHSIGGASILDTDGEKQYRTPTPQRWTGSLFERTEASSSLFVLPSSLRNPSYVCVFHHHLPTLHPGPSSSEQFHLFWCHDFSEFCDACASLEERDEMIRMTQSTHLIACFVHTCQMWSLGKGTYE